MATTAKNFRIKQGLVVEGTTGTINGQNILTETGSDQYIIDLIGGQTLVSSVASGLSVNGSGELSINRTIVDGWYDASGAAATALQDAKDYADTGLSYKQDTLTAAQTVNKVVVPVSGNSYGIVGNASYLDVTNPTGYNSEIDVDIAAVESKLTTDGFALTSDISTAISTAASNYDAAGAAATALQDAKDYADALDTDDIAEGTTNKYFTNQRALDATASAYDSAGTAAGLAGNYDAAGAAATAEGNANDYTDSAIGGLSSVYEPIGTAAGLAGNYDASGAADAAEENAKSYADTLIGDNTVNGTAGNTVKDRIATAVANLVDSAPAALDTLNELAAALGDNVDGMTGIATAIGNKLPLAGGTMSGNIAMGTNKVTGLGAPSSDNDAATKKYVDDQTTTDVAEGTNLYFTNQRAIDATGSSYDPAGSAGQAEINANDYTDTTIGNVLDGDTAFTALNVNNVSGTYAAVSTVATVGTATAWSFDSAVFTSAKLLVKFKTATHTQVSEVLLTLDSSGNVAITEFAEVGTNGSLGTVTAVNTAGTVNVRVTTAYNATDVMVYATTLI